MSGGCFGRLLIKCGGCYVRRYYCGDGWVDVLEFEWVLGRVVTV